MTRIIKTIVLILVCLTLGMNLYAGKVVDAESFGVVADGDPTGVTGVGTDNSPKLQNAIDYLNTQGGGKLMLPAGTIEMRSGIKIYSNISIEGRGIDLTELQAQAGAGTDFIMLHFEDGGVIGTERNNRNVTLSNMSVNGNDNNISYNTKCLIMENAIYCFFLNVEFKQAELDNVTFKDCNNFFFSNMLIRDGNKSQLVLDHCTNMTFGSSVTIRTGSKWGVHFPVTSSGASERIAFNGVRFASSSEGGIGCFDFSRGIAVKGCDFVEGSGSTSTYFTSIYVDEGNADGWKIIGNTFTRSYGKCIDIASDNAQIKNNTIDSCRKTAITVRGIDNTVSNNDIIDAGYLADNTYDGIHVLGQRAEVHHNRIIFANDVSGVGNKLRYGINMDTNSNNGKCYENSFGTAAVTTALNVVPSSVSSYRNSGVAAQNAFVVATMSADQTRIGSAPTVVNFDTKMLDRQGDFDTGTQAFTAPADGYYRIDCSVDVENVAGTTSVVLRAENVTDSGVASLFNIQPGAFNGTMVISGIMPMSKDDDLQIIVKFPAGNGDVNDRSRLNIERINF